MSGENIIAKHLPSSSSSLLVSLSLSLSMNPRLGGEAPMLLVTMDRLFRLQNALLEHTVTSVDTFTHTFEVESSHPNRQNAHECARNQPLHVSPRLLAFVRPIKLVVVIEVANAFFFDKRSLHLHSVSHHSIDDVVWTNADDSQNRVLPFSSSSYVSIG